MNNASQPVCRCLLCLQLDWRSRAINLEELQHSQSSKPHSQDRLRAADDDRGRGRAEFPLAAQSPIVSVRSGSTFVSTQ